MPDDGRLSLEDRVLQRRRVPVISPHPKQINLHADVLVLAGARHAEAPHDRL